jgi:hypothetical protein
MNTRKFALTLTLLAGTLAASAAHAGGPAVQLSVELFTPTIRLPGHVVLPLPPIPVPRLAVVQPSRELVYAEPRYEVSYEGNYQGGYPSSDQGGYGAGPVRRYGRGDADRDGIPDRRDPVYNPRWDRDGDGVPNRYDARPNDPRYSRGWPDARRDGRGETRDDRRDGRRGHRGD